MGDKIGVCERLSRRGKFGNSPRKLLGVEIERGSGIAVILIDQVRQSLPDPTEEHMEQELNDLGLQSFLQN